MIIRMNRKQFVGWSAFFACVVMPIYQVFCFVPIGRFRDGPSRIMLCLMVLVMVPIGTLLSMWNGRRISVIAANVLFPYGLYSLLTCGVQCPCMIAVLTAFLGVYAVIMIVSHFIIDKLIDDERLVALEHIWSLRELQLYTAILMLTMAYPTVAMKLPF